MAVLDATALIHFLEPSAPSIIDPATDEPVTNAQGRIDHLVKTLEERREPVVVPTPALSEVLVHAGDAMAHYLEVLNGSAWFRIVPFDQRAAVELATILREAPPARKLRVGVTGTRASLKFDRQILAIARVAGEATIYSDDDDMTTLGRPLGFDVIKTHQLPLPPAEQESLF
ncbi:MAG: PIN domain-containing protein [Gammaproteobacteria bacterium]|nr:PIN domain-containing protein [Gammaproteobacteria bacterium]